MFPVLSLLRRGAASVVYVEPAHLQAVNGCFLLSVGQREACLLVAPTRWSEPRMVVDLHRAKVSGRCKKSTAVSLTRFENGLVTDLSLLDAPYTLILGEEVELEAGGLFTRTVCFGVVRGVRRLSNGKLRALKTGAPVTRRELPHGARRL